jgi:hypothetical protein
MRFFVTILLCFSLAACVSKKETMQMLDKQVSGISDIEIASSNNSYALDSTVEFIHELAIIDSTGTVKPVARERWRGKWKATKADSSKAVTVENKDSVNVRENVTEEKTTSRRVEFPWHALIIALILYILSIKQNRR